jgi:peptide-methionine (S)-S-oxide reductase
MNTRLVLLAAAAVLVLGIAATAAEPPSAPPKKEGTLATATFAGGCFWCMEPPFDKLPGVVSTTSGYIGGTKQNPTYKDVSAGGTGHAEAVQVVYDPGKVSYAQLLEVFWHNVDPLTANGQFCDKGDQYRSAIFFHDAEQQRLAEESKKQLEASGRFKQPIVTQVVPATTFYAAEEYHQDYYKKNPLRYRYYRHGCGRDARLEEVWGQEAPKK